eukprot:Nitzschia sp. Nitz4//scaffold3_size479765//296899//297816//NITZ4_000122-RA/size479765-processed-gene-1.523-mRNA-1//-1//CDS//3329550824//7100//frame0
MLTTLRRGVTPTTRIVQRGQRSTKVVSKTAEQPIIDSVSLESYAASRRTFDTTTSKAMAIGGLAGLCGSLAGMGGGFIMIPLMTSKYMLRLSQHQAHGTSLFAITTTGLAGALGYSGQVDYEAAAAIACTGMVTARIGAMATSMLSGVMLRRGLGLLMLCVSPLLPANAYLKEETVVDAEGQSERSVVQRVVVPAMIGSFSGLLAGLFGVGGGAIVVPALTVATDMNHYQALGTSLCAMTLPALVGTVTHYGKGNVAMRVAPALALGAFMGGFIGGNLGQTIDESKLRLGFSCLMLFLGGKTFLL